MGGGQSAPRFRFDERRPEPLNGDRALRFANRRRASGAVLTSSFALKFCRFSLGARAIELIQPAVERRPVEPMLATIFDARKTTFLSRSCALRQLQIRA
jgi:hypothetical protein